MKKIVSIVMLCLVVVAAFAVIAPAIAAPKGKSYTYTVVVQDGDGNPVADLWVRVVASTKQGSGTIGWLLTDASGMVTLYTSTRYSLLTAGYLSTLPTSEPSSTAWPDMVLFTEVRVRPGATITATFPGTAL